MFSCTVVVVQRSACWLLPWLGLVTRDECSEICDPTAKAVEMLVDERSNVVCMLKCAIVHRASEVSEAKLRPALSVTRT